MGDHVPYKLPDTWLELRPGMPILQAAAVLAGLPLTTAEPLSAQPATTSALLLGLGVIVVALVLVRIRGAAFRLIKGMFSLVA